MRRLNILLLLLLGLVPNVPAQPKRRVAVLNFDYATVQSDVAAIFGRNQDIGKGIADLLVDRFVNGAVYSVIERKQLDAILKEQNLSNSDRADANTAAKVGRVLGVDAIVIGSITQFGRDDKSASVGGSALGGLGRKYGLGGVGKKESKAAVDITARLINVETAEILASATGHGSSERSGTTLLASGGSPINMGAGGVDMSSRNFAQTIIGEAVKGAVSDVAMQLERSASALPRHQIQVSGLVADASGDTLVLNIGSKAGVQVGDKLLVSRPIRVIRDPATGKVIRQVEDKLGEVVITDVDALSSVGKYSGTGQVKVGDAVKN